MACTKKVNNMTLQGRWRKSCNLNYNCLIKVNQLLINAFK